MKQRSIRVSRSIILSAAGVLAVAASLIQPRSANAQPAPTQQTPAQQMPTQQMPTMQLGTQMMMPSETAFFGKLLPSVVSINVVKDVAKAEPAANAAGTSGGTQHSFGTGFV